MIDAVLRVHLPCSWVTLVTEALGATVSIVEQKPVGNGLLQSLVEIEPGDEGPQAVVDALRGNRDIADIEAIVPKRGKILATLQVRECHACQAISESECFLTDATATTEGGVEWHLLAPRRSAIEGLVRILRDRGLEVEVAAIKSAKTAGLLTDRQQRAIDIAYKLGYYEIPKKIDLSRLAKKLGVSKSTLSEMLRTGEAKILHTYFHGLLKKPR